MMNDYRVYKREGFGAFPWTVEYCWDTSEKKLFRTHAEALEYADKKARARLVVKPRVKNPENLEFTLEVEHDEQGKVRANLYRKGLIYRNLVPEQIRGLCGLLLVVADKRYEQWEMGQ